MKTFLDKLGQWLRNKIRCIIIKQWKKPKTVYRNLMKLNRACKCHFSEEEIYKCANTRLGWYGRSAMNVVNFILSSIILAIGKRDRLGLVRLFNYYLMSL